MVNRKKTKGFSIIWNVEKIWQETGKLIGPTKMVNNKENIEDDRERELQQNMVNERKISQMTGNVRVLAKYVKWHGNIASDWKR